MIKLMRHTRSLIYTAVFFCLSATSSSGDSYEALVERANANTLTIISGNPNGAYLQLAYDMAAVLNDGNNFRLLPIVGTGGAQNIRDVLFLRGVDMAIVETDKLRFFKETNEAGKDVEKNLRYITKICNEHFHILAGPDIKSVEDLNGKIVNFSDAGSGTQLTARFLFRDLGIKVTEVNGGQADAIVKIKSGKIAATVLMAPAPAGGFKGSAKDFEGLHFVPMPFKPVLANDYLPAQLTSADYPNLIKENETVDTVSVGALLIVFNWPFGSDRYRRVAKFVDTFFANSDKLLLPPRHAKWRELVLTADVAGWTRFDAAQKLVDRMRAKR